MIKPILADAVRELVGGAISGGETFESIIYHDGQTPPSDSAIDAKLASMVSDWEAQAYARNRKEEYPNIGDQLDDLYHAGAFSAEMTAKIKKVKDDNPKG